jgi:hypothetical protein
MKTADPAVSIDLLVKTLLAMGASLADVAQVIRKRPRRAA